MPFTQTQPLSHAGEEKGRGHLIASWTLTCVRADVAAQQPRPGERLSAGGAHARQRVRADVHLERSQAGVFLGAVLAEKGRSGGCDGWSSFLLLLFLLRGADVGNGAGALHPLAGGVRVHGLRARGIRGATFVFLATAAGAAAEAGR